MKYMLDVNALIALAHDAHTMHTCVVAWALRLPAPAVFLTTPLTELGFCRISVTIGLQPDVAAARAALRQLKASPKHVFEFLPDTLGVDAMPAGVKRPSRLTDGHLLKLAKVGNATLATFDCGIKDTAVFLIS